jgi:hypothetical protein
LHSLRSQDSDDAPQELGERKRQPNTLGPRNAPSRTPSASTPNDFACKVKTGLKKSPFQIPDLLEEFSVTGATSPNGLACQVKAETRKSLFQVFDLVEDFVGWPRDLE